METVEDNTVLTVPPLCHLMLGKTENIFNNTNRKVLNRDKDVLEIWWIVPFPQYFLQVA